MLVFGAGALSMVGVGFFGGGRFGDFFFDGFLYFFLQTFLDFGGFGFFCIFFCVFLSQLESGGKTVFESRWTIGVKKQFSACP